MYLLYASVVLVSSCCGVELRELCIIEVVFDKYTACCKLIQCAASSILTFRTAHYNYIVIASDNLIIILSHNTIFVCGLSNSRQE